MPKISIYKNAWDNKGTGEIELDFFIRDVQEGKWQDQVLKVRTVKEKKERDELKKKVPMVTIAGTFSERADKNITQHSGFICIDIDNISDLNDTKSQVYTDEHVFAGFDSISGYGLCLLFKINSKKHREAFAGISEYLYSKYSIVIDPTSVNQSRARFVTYDPNLFYNPNAKKFEKYPEKQIPLNKYPKVIFAQNDFENIIAQIVNKGIDIVPNYHEWLRIGFGLADKFGEGGRQYFHNISSVGQGYTPSLCDKQFTACLRQRNGVTIGTLYYYAKQAGIETVSKETKIIAQTAQFNKKSEKTKEDAKEKIKKEGIAESATTNAIIDQVFDQNINSFSDDSLLSKLELYLRQSYDLKRNVITRKIEVDGKYLDDRVFNDIWCDATKIFEKVTSEMLQRLINSSFTVDFNPFEDFFRKYSLRNPSGTIESFFSCIESDSGLYGNEFFPDFAIHFGRKWIVGLISAAHGKHSPLCYALTGGINTGKTEFWRRILPDELKDYYGESKLDAGKDDEILMCQKWLIMDDEMGGKSKQDDKHFKNLTSKQTFSLREPYGKNNVDLKRIAVLCGTSNDPELIKDSSTNRRIIPVSVISIDHEKYNQIDKIDLIMEAYNLWKSGFDWQLTKDDIIILDQNTGRFKEISIEEELIRKFFMHPKPNQEKHMMPTEIKVIIEQRSGQKTNKKKIIDVMKAMGYIYKQKKINNQPVWGFEVTLTE